METLTATERHHTTLTQLGCRTLGDIRRLPRGGVSRRFDKELLTALDQAYGLRPEVHTWKQIPEGFKARLELMSRVDMAPALLFGARRLVLQMCGWLAAQHAGITAFVLRWTHDSMRSKSVGEGGELIVRTAAPMREVEHLCRLLAENLAKVELKAPAGDIEVEALDVQALEEHSASLLPDTVEAGESLALVLERIAARLGREKVLRPTLSGDAMSDLFEAAQLLDIEVQQFARCIVLVAPNVLVRTQVGQLRHASTVQDTTDRQTRGPGVGVEACLQEQLSAQFDDGEGDAGVDGSRRQRGSRRLVGQCSRAAGQIASMPLSGVTALTPCAAAASEAEKLRLMMSSTIAACARRQDRDDMLFEILDGSVRLARVHFTHQAESVV